MPDGLLDYKEASHWRKHNWIKPKIELLKQPVSGLVQIGDEAAKDEMGQSSGVSPQTRERAVAP